jgi:tryptophanase
MNLPYAEPFRIKMVEEIYQSTKEEREQWLKEANYNLFNLKSSQVFIDLLTDSGTGAMSDKQWAALMTGDESYAGSRSFEQLQNTVERITGFKYLLPTHQGRAAENVLFSVLVKEGDVVPGNSHFDTTKGHIEFRKAHAIDCTIDEAFDINDLHPFKGNINLEKLEEVYKSHPKENIPFCLITITCNSSGGQPVSLENMKAVKALSDQYGIPVFFDSARFAENAYFIKKREQDRKTEASKKSVKKFSLMVTE